LIKLEDERFATVFLRTVLSYIGDPKKAVKEAYRILKPDGHVVVSFLATEGSYAMLYDLAYLRGRYDPEISPKYPYPIKLIKGAHWNSIEEINNLLKEAGFVDFKYI
jgi:ubiquinone/menaquinone biosynthesis C-methylase UbiE